MPTLPPEPLPETHEHRDVAESFGEDAERYDRTRPRYPEALVTRIAGAAPGPYVLDVGCGTGIAARQFKEAGCHVLGVDPDLRMAALARRAGIETEVSAFETWQPAGREFDAVIAAQAWHWVDPVAGARKAAEVLRPNGRLAVFWNVFQLPPNIAEAVADSCRRVMPDSPFDFTLMTKPALDVYESGFTKTADGIRQADAFTEPEQWRWDWEWSYTRESWLDVMPTQGAFTRLPADKMAEILEGVGAAIDDMGGTFTMPYATVAVTATRL